jgi:hypothetical protein
MPSLTQPEHDRVIEIILESLQGEYGFTKAELSENIAHDILRYLNFI